MRARNFCHLSSVLVLVFFLLCYTPCFAAPIAKVLSLVPGVVAEREGKTVPLQVKDDIYLQDVLRSNANGKAQIIFEDDTVLTLGNNTTFSMQEYNDTDNPAFKGNMGGGFVRFVTGQIVSKNPEAFKVNAPQCTIGIRGTTFAVQSTDQDTVVFTENSSNQQSVTANGIHVPPGSKIGFHPDGTTEGVLPMTPQDRQTLSIDGSVGGAGANQNNDGQSPLVSSGQNLPDAAGGNPSGELGSSLTDVTTASTLPGQNPAPPPVPDTIAYGGGLFTKTPGSANQFVFEANLTTGAISNAWMKSTETTDFTDFNATGGSGTISGSSYAITGNTGSYNSNTINHWEMNGSGLTVGGSTGGSYQIGISGNSNVENGTFSGNITALPYPLALCNRSNHA